MIARGKQLFSGLADRAKIQLDAKQFESVRVGGELERQWTATFKDFEARSNELQKQIEASDGLARFLHDVNSIRQEMPFFWRMAIRR